MIWYGSSVTGQWVRWGVVKNAGLSYSSSTTRSYTMWSSKQPNKPCPAFYSQCILLLFLIPTWTPSTVDCCSVIWSGRPKDAVWSEMTAYMCVVVCVCSEIEQRAYCNGESGRLYYQQRNSDYFPERVCLHTCGRNFSLEMAGGGWHCEALKEYLDILGKYAYKLSRSVTTASRLA